MRRLAATILCIVAAIMVSGCARYGAPTGRKHVEYDAAPPAGAVADKTAPNLGLNLAGSKRIKKGRISFECADLERTATRIREAVTQFGGYITEDMVETRRTRSGERFKIRVPAANFDKLFARIPMLSLGTRKTTCARRGPGNSFLFLDPGLRRGDGKSQA